MIQITAHMRILVATQPISFRNRIDGTSSICRNVLDNEPLDGTLFVFINRRKTMIRFYMFDGQGEWLCDKRIAKGSFPHWVSSEGSVSQLEAHQLYVLIRGGNPQKIVTPSDWKKIK